MNKGLVFGLMALMVLGGFAAAENVTNVALIAPAHNSWSNTNATSNISFTANFWGNSDYAANVTGAVLWGNFTGVWAANSTNTSVIVNATNFVLNVSGLKDGYYVWNVNVTTNSSAPPNGFYAPTNFTIKVDTFAPICNLNGPPNNAFSNNNPPSFNILPTELNFGQLDRLEFWSNFTGGGLMLNASNSTGLTNNTNHVFNTYAQEGFFIWNGRVFDAAGNQAPCVEPNTVIKVDRTAPTCALNTPATSSSLSVSTRFFNFTPQDVGAGVGQLGAAQFWQNCTGTWHLNATNSSALANATQFGFNLTYAPEKYCVWSMNVTDAAGNAAFCTGANSTVEFDRTAPYCVLSSPSDGSYTGLSYGAVNYTPNSTSAMGQFLSAALWLNSTGTWALNASNASAITNGSVNNFINATYVPEGNITYSVNLTDRAGNSAFCTKNRTVVSDRTAPVVTQISPTDLVQTSSNSFAFKFTDSLAPTSYCSLILATVNTSQNAAVLPSTSTSLTASMSGNPYRGVWYINCVDKAGNSASSASKTIVYAGAVVSTGGFTTSPATTVVTGEEVVPAVSLPSEAYQMLGSEEQQLAAALQQAAGTQETGFFSGISKGVGEFVSNPVGGLINGVVNILLLPFRLLGLVQ